MFKQDPRLQRGKKKKKKRRMHLKQIIANFVGRHRLAA